VFGREQEIEIGHMSGESNVIYWLRKRHIEPEATLVKQILGAAKATDHLLTEDEVQLIIKEFKASGGATVQAARRARRSTKSDGIELKRSNNRQFNA